MKISWAFHSRSPPINVSESRLDLTDSLKSGKDFFLLKKQTISDPSGCRVLPEVILWSALGGMQDFKR